MFPPSPLRVIIALYAALFVAECWQVWPRFSGPLAANLVLSLACFLCGVPLTRRREGWPAALACLVQALFFLDEVNYLLLQRGVATPMWARPLAFINPWQMAALYFAVAAFPRRAAAETGRWRWLHRAVVALTFVQWIAWLRALAGMWKLAAPLGGPHALANALGTPLLYAAAAAVALRNYRALRDPLDRRRVQWVIAAFCVAAGCMIVFHGLNAMGVLPPGAGAYLNLPGFLIPAAAAHALLTRDLLGVRVVVRRTLQYLLARRTLEALIAAPFLLLAFRAGGLLEPAWLWLSAILAGVAGLLGRQRLLDSLDRRFFRESWNQERLLTSLLENIRTGVDFTGITTAVETHLQAALQPEWLEIVTRPRRAADLPAVVRSGATLEVPLREGAGMLRFGPRKAGLPYGAPEQALLQAVAAHLSLALENHWLAQERAEAVLAERLRLARDLHDTLAQGFAGISLHLESARQTLREDPGVAESHLREARALARTSLAEARRSVHDLRTADADLPSRLRTLAAEVQRSGGLRVDVECHGEADLTHDVAADFYRIAQECLTNALKHSRASRAALRLALAPGGVTLEVEDDGRGFDPARLTNGGFGLTGMRERAERMGARLRLFAQPGSGVRVEVTKESAAS